MEYKGAKEKVCIICNEKDKFGIIHGEFWKTPSELLHKRGNCPRCSNRFKYSKEEFIERANIIHRK